MDTNKVLKELYNQMKATYLWFDVNATTPLQEELILDEYGELSDKRQQEQIAKQIVNLIGNGALDLDEAIDTWIDDTLDMGLIKMFCTFPYKEKKEEAVKESYIEYKVRVPLTIEEFKAAISEDKMYEAALEELEDTFTDEYIEQTWNYYKTENPNTNIKEIVSVYIDDGYPTKYELVVVLKIEPSEDNLQIIDEVKNLINELIEEFEVNVPYETTDPTFVSDPDKPDAEPDIVMGETHVYIIPELDLIRVKTTEYLAEGKVLTEGNEVVEQEINDPNFNPESSEGQVLLRTQQLYTQLMQARIDSDVTYDNGEGQVTITLNDGGQIIIPITDNNTKLEMVGNNLVLNQDLVQLVNQLIQIIDRI
nr:MAG TPA: hypothetical protein [Caudoviricetes sp.]